MEGRFGGKACGCEGRLGGKMHGRLHSFATKMHRADGGSKARTITVDRAIGAGDMGPGRQPLLGNTHSALSNGQRDLIDHGNAQTAMVKRNAGANPIESRKKNKAQ